MAVAPVAVTIFSSCDRWVTLHLYWAVQCPCVLCYDVPAQVYCNAGIVYLQPVQVATSAPDRDLPDLGTDMNVGATALLQVRCSACTVQLQCVQCSCSAVQCRVQHITL
jgi:hypothetical protein